jgi:hypothetical protein
MDSLTLLVARFQLEDVQALQNDSKGKARYDAPLTDAQHALLLTQALLEADIQLIQDEHLAKSLARASELDGDALDAFLHQEALARRDRELAQRLSRAQSTAPSRGTYTPPEPVSTNVTHGMAGMQFTLCQYSQPHSSPGCYRQTWRRATKVLREARLSFP